MKPTACKLTTSIILNRIPQLLVEVSGIATRFISKRTERSLSQRRSILSPLGMQYSLSKRATIG